MTAAAFAIDDPLTWFDRLQRAYIERSDEALLEEVADLGRMMAVTDFPLEGIVEVHGQVLTDALAANPAGGMPGLVAAAATCLSELLVAHRVASVGVAGDSGSRSGGDHPLADFIHFLPGGALAGETVSGSPAESPQMGSPPRDLFQWIEELAGRERSEGAREAVARRRMLMFEARLPGDGGHIRVIVCPFHDGGGIMGSRDISRLVNAREEAFQRRRLESVGQLAGGLAHELNNLLQPIVSMAQMAREDCAAKPEDAELEEALSVILDCALRAAEIVHGMLVYVRRSPRGLTAAFLGDAVAQELDTIRRTLPAGIALEFHGPDEAASVVSLQTGELGQILKNIVRNAAQAMAGSGRITVTVDEILAAPAQAVRLQVPAGRYGRLTIADTGPGIAAGQQDHIFEPFFTTKDIGMGTGLGLSIVQGIVKSWGGVVIARNHPEGGAVFEILLPATEPPSASHAAAAGRQHRGEFSENLGQGRIALIVDDDTRVLGAWERLLKRGGFDARAFVRGEDAVAAAVRGDGDLLLTDLVMPGMDGPELIGLVRQARPGIRVIVATGGAGHETDVEDAMLSASALGADEILLKPVPADRLFETLKRLYP
ncbi:MAG TPA: ATP-binding protein [Skermanella sp.]|jgi:signal transduction histidine kinase/CheY-like chemotaxis protein|nr:ATP-binding protein [Skermanella sp.]